MNNIEYKIVKVRYEKEKSSINIINHIYKDGIGIGCLDGEVVITEFIPSGKKQMLVSSYLNGIKKEELIGVKINEK